MLTICAEKTFLIFLVSAILNRIPILYDIYYQSRLKTREVT